MFKSLILRCLGLIVMCCSGCLTHTGERSLVWVFVDEKGGQFSGAWEPGRTEFESIVVTNKRSGVLMIHDAVGTVCRVSDYSQGTRISDVSYYPNGTVRATACWTNGLLNGLITHYWENGQMSVQQWFLAGIRNGPFRAWSPNGKRTHEGAYVSGEEDGPWTRWINDETIWEREMWNNGKLVSSERYESGKRVPSIIDVSDSKANQAPVDTARPLADPQR